MQKINEDGVVVVCQDKKLTFNKIILTRDQERLRMILSNYLKAPSLSDWDPVPLVKSPRTEGRSKTFDVGADAGCTEALDSSGSALTKLFLVGLVEIGSGIFPISCLTKLFLFPLLLAGSDASTDVSSDFEADSVDTSSDSSFLAKLFLLGRSTDGIWLWDAMLSTSPASVFRRELFCVTAGVVVVMGSRVFLRLDLCVISASGVEASPSPVTASLLEILKIQQQYN